jgi:hypothetical protein
MTPFEEQLHDAFAALDRGRVPETDGFWFLWRQGGGPDIKDLAGFRAACDRLEGGPLELAHLVHRLLLTPEWQRIRTTCPQPLRSLIRALALAAIERYLRGQSAVAFDSAAGPVRIEMNDQLAADIVAAVHHGCGLAVAPHPQSGEWQAVSVRHDLPVLAWGVPDSAYEVCKADLLAWADGYQSATHWLEQAINPGQARKGDRVDLSVLKFALDDVARAFKVRPMFAIHDGSSSPLARDAALRARLASELGVHCYFYAPPAAGQPLPESAAQLQGTLRRFVAEVLAKSDRTDPAPPSAASGPATVFVSYAHEDGDAWRLRIVQMIQGIGGSVEIDPWDDQRIGTGALWQIEIEQALARAGCAVLILTPGFLASRFIKVVELPRMLAGARERGLHLFPVLAEHCPWTTHRWLEERQLFPGSTPLADQPALASALLTKLAVDIHQRLSR